MPEAARPSNNHGAGRKLRLFAPRRGSVAYAPDLSMRRPLGLALIAALAFVLVWFAVGAQLIRKNDCPVGVASAQPSDIRLQPSLQEHQSWVALPAGEFARGDWLALCVDGHAVGGEGIEDESDLSSDTYRLGVRTRWVLWMWLKGALPNYQDAQRWTIVWLARSR
jgi:hypothetical protein